LAYSVSVLGSHINTAYSGFIKKGKGR